MIPDSPLMTVIPGHGDYPDTGGPGKQSPAIITDYYNTGSHPATSDAKIAAQSSLINCYQWVLHVMYGLKIHYEYRNQPFNFFLAAKNLKDPPKQQNNP